MLYAVSGLFPNLQLLYLFVLPLYLDQLLLTNFHCHSPTIQWGFLGVSWSFTARPFSALTGAASPAHLNCSPEQVPSSPCFPTTLRRYGADLQGLQLPTPALTPPHCASSHLSRGPGHNRGQTSRHPSLTSPLWSHTANLCAPQHPGTAGHGTQASSILGRVPARSAHSRPIPASSQEAPAGLLPLCWLVEVWAGFVSSLSAYKLT